MREDDDYPHHLNAKELAGLTHYDGLVSCPVHHLRLYIGYTLEDEGYCWKCKGWYSGEELTKARMRR